MYAEDENPVYVCKFFLGNKRTRFGYARSASHQEWLVNEFNRVLALLKSRT